MLWAEGRLTALAESAVPSVVESLLDGESAHRPYMAVLLGLLAEAEGETAGSVRTAIRAGLGGYLRLLARSDGGDPLALGLCYLLGQLHEDAAEVLPALAHPGLSTQDRGRLERCLRPLDPAEPTVGRAWPSPGVWATLTEAEREHDRTWARRLPEDRLRAAWDSETRSLLAYNGAKALWAAEHGRPAPETSPDLSPPPVTAHGPAADPAEGFRCPACHGRLPGSPEGVRCAGCERHYPVVDGCLDFSLGAGDGSEDMTRNLPLRYGDLRSAFFRVMGENWDDGVSIADEDDYLRRYVTPAEGDVLDLAAGPGRWTAVLAGSVGVRRVIALDLSLAMLGQVRRILPGVRAVRGNALAMPFGSGSLGAVNCWNALQSMPDPATVIGEVGRCLRPGGVFTALTFRPADDPVYRYLQTRPFGMRGVRLSRPAELRERLADAGLSVVDIGGPGTFVFVTAVRDA